MKIRPVEADLFRSNGQTDMTKLVVAFHNFAKASESEFVIFGSLPMCIFFCG
jgi:hypothetical protein